MKTRPYITERLLMGRKESNKKNCFAKVSVFPVYKGLRDDEAMLKFVFGIEFVNI